MHNTPATTVTFARRSALESISDTLEQYSYEEVPQRQLKRQDQPVMAEIVPHRMARWCDIV